jgi:hypothetical protein
LFVFHRRRRGGVYYAVEVINFARNSTYVLLKKKEPSESTVNWDIPDQNMLKSFSLVDLPPNYSLLLETLSLARLL